MIIFKEKSAQMLDRISQKLDQAGLEEYEMVTDVPEDSVSITGELLDTIVYLPQKYEYLQYDVSDFIRTLSPSLRSTSEVNRDLIKIKVRGKLTEPQYFKLIKYLIDETEFCSIIE